MHGSHHNFIATKRTEILFGTFMLYKMHYSYDVVGIQLDHVLQSCHSHVCFHYRQIEFVA